MALINKKTARNNWKIISAVSLAGIVALSVGLTCAFFPPAIPFIAGISVFGAKIFAGIGVLAESSVIGASFASAGLALATFIGGSALAIAFNKSINFLDNLFMTKKTHIDDFENELIVPTGAYGAPELRKRTHAHPSVQTGLEKRDPGTNSTHTTTVFAPSKAPAANEPLTIDESITKGL